MARDHGDASGRERSAASARGSLVDGEGACPGRPFIAGSSRRRRASLPRRIHDPELPFRTTDSSGGLDPIPGWVRRGPRSPGGCIICAARTDPQRVSCRSMLARRAWPPSVGNSSSGGGGARTRGRGTFLRQARARRCAGPLRSGRCGDEWATRQAGAVRGAGVPGAQLKSTPCRGRVGRVGFPATRRSRSNSADLTGSPPP